MDVGHCLPGLGTGVEDETVTAFADTLGHRDMVRLAHNLGEQPARCACERRRALIVVLGDDQNVHGRLRVDIAEGHRAVRLQDLVSREFPGSNLAEQAVWHALIVSAVPGNRERASYP